MSEKRNEIQELVDLKIFTKEKNEAVQLRNYETQVYKLLERHLGSY